MTHTANFVALDVETAKSWSAACSIGIAVFEEGKLVGEHYSLIDPKTEFHPRCIDVHGINEDAVRGAPGFVEVIGKFRHLIENQVIAAHNNNYDRTTMQRDAKTWGVALPHCRWLDTMEAAQRVWPRLPSYDLSTVCGHIGHSFGHHHALEDAKAAGHVLVAAMQESGLDMNGMIEIAG